MDGSLRRLGLETIDLYQLHRIDPMVPAADQVGALHELRKEGKIRHIGLSEVSVADIGEARLTAPIASVQNVYNLLDRGQRAGPGLLRAGRARLHPVLPDRDRRAREPGRAAGAAGPAVRLHPGPAGAGLAAAPLPGHAADPGHRPVAHLEENVGAAQVELTDEQFAAMSGLARNVSARGQLSFLPADIRSWQASTTRAVIDSSAALPQARGS